MRLRNARYIARRPTQHATASRATGFTLIELMIGIVVGLIVIAAVTALYVTAIRGAIAITQETRLTQEARIGMNLIVNDVRRAGYAFPHSNRIGEDPDTLLPINPFMTDERNLSVHGGGPCITFSYDPTFRYTPDPSDMKQDLSDLDTTKTQYVFGYRLVDGVLQVLTNETHHSSTKSCPEESWASLTDPSTTNITNIEFELDTTGCLNTSDDTRTCLDANTGDILIEKRRVNVSLKAEHAREPLTAIKLEESIAVRNDRIYAAD